jgi:predicted ATPase
VVKVVVKQWPARALEKLDKSEESQSLRCRHAQWCLGLAEEAEARLNGPGSSKPPDHLEAEHDNIRKALRWTLGHEDAEVGL